MGSTRIGGGTFVTGLVALCALACVACGEADAPAPAAPRQAAPAASPKPAPATSAPAATPAPSASAPTDPDASEPTAPKAPTPAPAELVARGRQVYMSNCTACHNMDPGLPGTLGPEITGASLELIEARVLHGAYPPGHVPKRDTKLMLALPYLAADLGALAAYLDE